MSQVTRKFVTADAIDGTKIHLDNNQAIRARNAANNADVNIIKLDGSNIVQVVGALNASGAVSGSNLSGTNTGDLTLTAVGASPAADGASLSGQALTLQPFDGTHPGVVTASGGGTANFLRADGTWAAPSDADATNKKELTALGAGDITNQYIDLTQVAMTDSIEFVVKGGGVQIEGASYDYSVSYTGGAGGKTRITFLNDLATGGVSALVATDVVVAKYQY